MTDFFDSIATRELIIGAHDARGNFVPVATTAVMPNNRGAPGRISTQFAPGLPAESETIPGVGSFKKGEIIAQNILMGPETPDGKNRRRITTTIAADAAGGLSGVIDSTTTAESGGKGQDDAMPLVFNVGEANGTYIALFADGRVKFRHGDKERTTTVAAIVAAG